MTDDTPGSSMGSEDETRVFVRGSSAAHTSSGALAVRCPKCQALTSLASDASLESLTCSSCGGQFSLAGDSGDGLAWAPLASLGRFELVECLGVGGFGAVWKALDKELDRTVAIKIPRQGAITPGETEKFLREARAAAQLRHPSIVSVHEVGRDGGSLFIVSDLVHGSTLGDWAAGRPLTGREAAALCAKIADALQHAHEHGVIHRDLKPANILMDARGEPHLTDFGLARREAGEATLTLEGDVLGTPAYMSPEQAGGSAHAADRRSDVYSLAVILFQLTTGELPFRGNPRMLVHQVLNDPPPSPRKFNAAIGKDLETITLKGLEKDPGRRFATANAMAEELRRYVAGQPILARPAGRVERAWRLCRRHPQVAALSGLLVAALVGGAVVSTWQAVRASRSAAQFRQERDRAEESLALAEKVVQDYLTRVAEDERLSQAGFHELRSELLETAEPFYDRFAELKPGDADGEAERAGAYARLATIRSETGQAREAVGKYEQAIAILSSLVGRYPAEPKFQQELAKYHQGAGWNLLLTGDLEAGQRHYEQSLGILEKLVAGFPDQPGYRQLLAAGREGFGLVLRDRHAKAARRQLERAVQELEKLVTAYPDMAAYERSLASSCFYLGHLLRRAEPEAAERYLARAEQLQRGLAERSPKEPEHQAALAETMSAQAYVLSVRKELAAADARYMNAIALQQRVAAAHPQVVKYRIMLAGIYSDHAGYYAAKKLYGPAALEYGRFSAVYDKLAEEFPAMRKYARNAATGHGQCAFYYYLLGNSQSAIDHRQQAEDIRKRYPQHFTALEMASQGNVWQRAVTFLGQWQTAGGVEGIKTVGSEEVGAADVTPR